MKYITHSPSESVDLGKKVGKKLHAGDFVAFTGDLGAGKTTFTRGVAEAFGMEDVVTSPTFTLVNEYDGRVPIYHFDMYRIFGEEGLDGIGFYDYPLETSIFLVEWSENIKDEIPENAVRINISRIDDTTREFLVTDGTGDERF